MAHEHQPGVVQLPAAVGAGFYRIAVRHLGRLACLETRVEYRFAATSSSPAEILRDFLAARQRVGVKRR